MLGVLRGDSDRATLGGERYSLAAYATVTDDADDSANDEDDEILDEKPFVSVREEVVDTTAERAVVAEEVDEDIEDAEDVEGIDEESVAVAGDSRGYKKPSKNSYKKPNKNNKGSNKNNYNKAQYTKGNRKKDNKSKKDASKAVKKAKNQLKKAQKQKKNAHRFAEMLPEVLGTSGDGSDGPNGPGGDCDRNLAVLFSGLDNDNLHQLKLDLIFFFFFYSERIKHLIAKKEKKRKDKSTQINDGTWKQKVTHPHRGSQRGMDGFAMEIAFDLSKARSDGKCGKSTNWAPCPLVPILGNTMPTSCCNFDTNHCIPAWQCDCPHCVDYAHVNQATVEVKNAIADKTYTDDVNGIVLRNRDLFHLWAVENIFQPKLLKDVLIKLNEQSSNVLGHIHNAAANECLSRGKALDKAIKLPLMMKMLALQREHRYTDVLKQIIMSFVPQKSECVKKLGNSFHKVDKIQSTVQKAVMKMQQDLSPGQRHVIDVPEHFKPEHSRKERKILANSVKMPPQ
jgi:hypothetical protein